VTAGRALSALGCLCALVAYRFTGSAAGGLAWAGAALIACLGYGAVLCVALRLQPPTMVALSAGLTAMVLIATGLAHLGLLGPPVMAGLVGIGLALGLALPPVLRRPRFPIAMCAVGAVGVVLACLRFFGEDRLINDDELNHVMALKRLWDTGALGGLHQLGWQVVGEAIFALAAGAQAPFFFDGVCALLIMLLLASAMARRDDGYALPALVVLCPWMLLLPNPTVAMVCRWPSGLLHVSMFSVFLHLGHERRAAVLVGVAAAALVALRVELAPLALTYTIAAIAGPRARSWTRRDRWRAAATWAAALAVMAWWSGAPALVAVGKALAALACIPVAVGALSLVGSMPWWSPAGVALLGMISTVAASALHMVPMGSRSLAVALSVFYHLPCLLALLLEPATFARPRPTKAELAAAPPGRLFPLTAAILLGGLFSSSIFRVAFRDEDRTATTNRFVKLAATAEMSAMAGFDLAIDRRLARLQLQVPAGARLGVWGKSAALLDYRRNPIVDASWSSAGKKRWFLAPLTAPRLAAFDYLLVETFVRSVENPEDVKADEPTTATPTLLVNGQLELVASEGAERLYRVRR
jgi:hypothetical protein